MRQRTVLRLSAAVLTALAAGPPAALGQVAPRTIGVTPVRQNAARSAVEDYWTDLLRSHPIEATVFVGDHRGDHKLNDPSVGAYLAWLGRLKEFRARLDPPRPPKPGESPAPPLTAQERIDVEVLKGMLDDRIALEPFRDYLMPVCQMLRSPTDVRADDLHLAFAQLGEFHPANTPGDLDNYDRRLDAFPKLVDGLIAVMRRGIAEKVTPPRVVMVRVVTQLRALAPAQPEGSPLWAFLNRLPTDYPVDDYHDAIDRVRHSIKTRVTPAYKKLADFVETEYLPACRETVGLCNTPDGQAHYALLLRHYTTTDLTPDQVHEIGLAQVARVRAGMEAVRAKLGVEGELSAFLAGVRDDPKLRNVDSKGIIDRHREILSEMEQNLPKLFGKLPLTPFEVRPFDHVRAKSSPAGEYLPLPSDGSRPGVFFVNTSDATSRPTYTMQALAYHEAVPGHHLQGALAAEAGGRPPFRRYFYLPAFDEGWALYAEGLPAELGLYRDPYAELGRLSYDAQRCVRLVVDTGIHARGWSRDKAIDYFTANTAIPLNEIENEVDRYIAWPGQALAYKIGELKIREIRAKWEARLGKRFDLRAFHDRLLGYGSLPLRVLERLMDEPDPQPATSRP